MEENSSKEEENEEGEEYDIDTSASRRSLRQRAAAAQQRQAEAVNKLMGTQSKKKILDVGDIGLIKVEGNVKAATDFPWLPVAVVKVHPGKGELVPTRYSVCSRDGYLKGTFGRNEIQYQELQTKKTMGINPKQATFKKNLTVAKASSLYNVHGGSYSCQCKGACTVESRCTCRMNNVFCTSKCHRGRGGNNLCRNFCVHEDI